MASNSKKWNHQSVLLAVALVSLVCFIAILCSRPSFDTVNQNVNTWAVGIQTPTLTEAAKIIDAGFDTLVLLAVSIPIFAFLLIKKRTGQACLLIGAMAADALLLQLTKTYIVSARPLNALVAETSYSFPSGHLTSTIVLLGVLSYIALQNHGTVAKACLAAVVTAVAVVVGFDRIYLNAHWLTDVIAAPSLALFIIAASIFAIGILSKLYPKQKPPTEPARGASLSIRSPTLYGRAITRTAQTTLQMK
jgi:membrane-associated phospholipid phosphatase